MELKKEHYKDKDNITFTVNKLIVFYQNNYNERSEVNNCV